MENTETLNDLVEINNDRVAGYAKAEAEASDPELATLFQRMEAQSKQFADELKQFVKKEGETPANGTTLKGKIYRAWMEIKTSFKSDDKSVLELCEFGEDAAQQAYGKALLDGFITNDIRTVIERQKISLKESHDIIRNLRDKQPA